MVDSSGSWSCGAVVGSGGGRAHGGLVGRDDDVDCDRRGPGMSVCHGVRVTDVGFGDMTDSLSVTVSD